MRVLVACEFSGIVRDAFLARGHDAVSCDLLPTESPGPHIQGDVFGVLGDGWDLMVAHPPCTYVANLANRWLYSQPTRWQDMIVGAVMIRDLLAAPIPRVALENPVMGKWARLVLGADPTQTVQPWWFGHTETKATCLWLRNLPPLTPTRDVRAETYALPYNRRAISHLQVPHPDRWKRRSLTYPGLAAAMADQWGAE